MGNAFRNLDSTMGERRHLVRIVGHQPDPPETEDGQNLRGRQINPFVGVESQLPAGIDPKSTRLNSNHKRTQYDVLSLNT